MIKRDLLADSYSTVAKGKPLSVINLICMMLMTVGGLKYK
jgi:hypothetical protein